MTETLEKGDIFFLYRPRVEETEPEGEKDLQRLYLVLRPDGKKSQERLLIVGKKHMPPVGGKKREKDWAFVARASTKRQVSAELEQEEYETKTRGERLQPGARPAGEGRYAIVRHEDHTHLAYALELPTSPGDVQDELNIEKEASYILSVKNPEKPSPRGAGLDEERRAAYPKDLQEKFKDRRFIDVDPPAFLDHEGAEVVLISASDDVKAELGIDIDRQKETEHSAEILKHLNLEREKHPREPLFGGDWA